MAKAKKIKSKVVGGFGTVDDVAGTATIEGADGEIPCASDESIAADEQGDDLDGDGAAEE